MRGTQESENPAERIASLVKNINTDEEVNEIIQLTRKTSHPELSNISVDDPSLEEMLPHANVEESRYAYDPDRMIFKIRIDLSVYEEDIRDV